MPFVPSRWTRFTFQDSAVWLCPDRPSWFVPTAAGDRLLQHLQSGGEPRSLAEHTFLQRLPDPPQTDYPGRAAALGAHPGLKELWLHLSDRCNLACRHCLFSCGPVTARELPLTRARQHLQAAADLGCRLFAVTGGEPLLYPEFTQLVEAILALPDSRLALLSNGLLVRQHLQPAWPRERLHLQLSLDGRPEHHDHLRGRGRFAQLEENLTWLRQQGWRFTLSCCVTRDNAEALPWLVDYAADQGASALHLMWHFIHGRGEQSQHAEPLTLLEPLLAAIKRAEARGLRIDNLDNLKRQLFSPPGTIHDGSSAGWDSAAIGPDDQLYPSAATIGVKELATPLHAGLQTAWQGSPLLGRIRASSVAALDDPWRFLLGGGDFDHSFHHSAGFTGSDPYQPLFAQLALHLISQAASRLPAPPGAALRLKMGELLVDCGDRGPVTTCHGNCLLTLDGADRRSSIGAYYAAAVGDKRREILNPVSYRGDVIEHVPEAFRFRGYGCGSPVLDAALQPGERVVDLGCGSGVECFIAARLVGPRGEVIGIDMLEPMLKTARHGAREVRTALGYDNLQFLHGYLEDLPLPAEDTDLVVSNCVLNLSADKRRTFAEIFRILKPAGRMVAADVVCEAEPDAAILNDATLRGECISGALTQKDLAGILQESGFSGFRVLKRLPYRVVNGHPFFSLTFAVTKPASPQPAAVKVFYPGPAAGLLTPSGQWLAPGQTTLVTATDAAQLGDQLWQLDNDGFVSNVVLATGANCCLPPEAPTAPAPAPGPTRHDSGCLVCGAPLRYHTTEKPASCHFCGRELMANACCEQGHFVCDRCHTGDALDLIEHLCAQATTTDPARLLREIRQHPAMPLHGPQHHALVPALLLTVWRNSGQPVTPEQLRSAIRRGSEVSGGSCGYMGVCGAASGVGIAFSILLEATPLKATARQAVQNIVQQVLAEIATLEAARCCQRDCWIALRAGMKIAAEMWTLNVPPVALFACNQMSRNRECVGVTCPLWP